MAFNAGFNEGSIERGILCGTLCRMTYDGRIWVVLFNGKAFTSPYACKVMHMVEWLDQLWGTEE